MDDYDAGRVGGRIAGEVLLEVALAASTGGAGDVAVKSATVAKVVTKLDNLPVSTIPPPVMAKFDELAGLISNIATTKMCFVAGTPVHAVAGLRAIEKIRRGDLVR